MWNLLTFPRRFTALLPMLSVTHIMLVLLNISMNGNMQLTINSLGHFSLTRFFPDTSLTFSKIPDISLTAVKDFSRFSIQAVTLKEVLYLSILSSRAWLSCRTVITILFSTLHRNLNTFLSFGHVTKLPLPSNSRNSSATWNRKVLSSVTRLLSDRMLGDLGRRRNAVAKQ